MAALKFDTEAISTLIKRRHPDFDRLEAHWKFCRQSYKGGREYLDPKSKNVFRFYKEGGEEYKDRLARTYRANHTKRVVETVNQYLFKQRPIRDSKSPDILRKFWDRATRTKLSMDLFAKEIDIGLSTYGMVYVVVDRPPQVAASRAEEKLPYAYIVPPTHAIDMAYDEDGELAWIVIAEDYRDDGSPLASGSVQLRFRLWTRSEWYLFVPEEPGSDKYKLGGTGEHGLGVVPVTPVCEATGSRYSAPALIDDIVYMDRTLVNYGSLLDEIIYEQTYSQLVMPAEAMLPGSEAEKTLIAAAKNRIFTYAGGAGNNAPSFISPDASQAMLIIDAMNGLMKTIYAVTGTDNGDANTGAMSKGREYASGTVRAMDHASIENMLCTKAQALEKAEDEIAALVLRWMGDKNPEIDPNWVRYPSKFDIRGLTSDLDIGKQLAEIGSPVEVMRMHMKAIAEKLFPRLSAEEMAALAAAIDAWEPKVEKELGMAERETATREKQVDLTERGQDIQVELAEKAAAAQAKAASEPKPAKK